MGMFHSGQIQIIECSQAEIIVFFFFLLRNIDFLEECVVSCYSGSEIWRESENPFS